MKKVIILFILIASSIFSQAQFSEITPKIGLTFSTGQNLFAFELRSGYLLGASATYIISNKFSLTPGILFEQKREKFNLAIVDSSEIISAKEKLSYNYIILPVLFQYYPFEKRYVFFDGGLHAGYLLNVQYQVKPQNEENFSSKKKLDISHFNRLVFGLNLGGGFNIPINKNNNILIELQYENSFMKGNGFFDVKLQTFYISAGYDIKIGK